VPPTIASWRRNSRWPAWCAAAIALIGATATAWGAPLTSNTALPVAKGEFVFRQQFVFERSGDDPSGAGRDREAFTALAALGYGVNRNLAVFGVLPYVDKRLELTSGGQRLARSARGIGDASLFARYTVFQKNWPQRTLRVAPFAGLELPTGADDETDSFGRLPAAVQPGSGSFDPFGGIVATYQTLDFQIDAQLAYKANTEANNFTFGDVARFDLSLQYRLLPRKLTGGVPGFLYAILETNLIHRGNNETGGVEDANSGGVTLFVVPGLQYVTKRWIVEAGVQLAAFQDLNGTALENDYAVRAGFRFNF
jgi:hypothetical protein